MNKAVAYRIRHFPIQLLQQYVKCLGLVIRVGRIGLLVDSLGAIRLLETG